jgi:hypothetical protein
LSKFLLGFLVEHLPPFGPKPDNANLPDAQHVHFPHSSNASANGASQPRVSHVKDAKMGSIAGRA